MIEKRGDLHGQIKTILNASLFLLPLGLLIAYANYLRFGNSLESGYGAHPGIGFGVAYFFKMVIPSLLSLNYGDSSTNYPLSITGGNADEAVDLSDYESFRGFNFWPVHALKFFGFVSAIRAVELSLLFLVLILQFGLLKLHLPYLLQRRIG